MCVCRTACVRFMSLESRSRVHCVCGFLNVEFTTMLFDEWMNVECGIECFWAPSRRTRKKTSICCKWNGNVIKSWISRRRPVATRYILIWLFHFICIVLWFKERILKFKLIADWQSSQPCENESFKIEFAHCHEQKRSINFGFWRHEQ